MTYDTTQQYQYAVLPRPSREGPNESQYSIDNCCQNLKREVPDGSVNTGANDERILNDVHMAVQNNAGTKNTIPGVWHDATAV